MSIRSPQILATAVALTLIVFAVPAGAAEAKGKKCDVVSNFKVATSPRVTAFREALERASPRLARILKDGRERYKDDEMTQFIANLAEHHNYGFEFEKDIPGTTLQADPSFAEYSDLFRIRIHKVKIKSGYAWGDLPGTPSVDFYKFFLGLVLGAEKRMAAHPKFKTFEIVGEEVVNDRLIQTFEKLGFKQTGSTRDAPNYKLRVELDQ